MSFQPCNKKPKFFRSPEALFSADTVLVVEPVSGDAEVIEVQVVPVSEDTFSGTFEF
jgi:hypothetical protein